MLKLFRRLSALALALTMLLSVCPTGSADGASSELTILFTHDTHSHFELSTASQRGGYARLATLLDRQRQEAEGSAVITLDGGDFAIGSLYHSIFTTDAPELRTLGALGYDAATVGNHEFDFRAQGFADMLSAATASGDRLPQLVLANCSAPAPGDDAYTDGSAALASALEDYPVRDYTVIERDGVRVAVFGLLGYDANDCAPMSGLVFGDPIEAARRVVADIQENEDYDYLVCLSHSGTSSKNSASEDYKLAKSVPGIDVIISGHTHTTLTEPINVGGTLIVSCGEYTENLGVLKLSCDSDGSVVMDGYQLIPVTADVTEDPEILEMTESFKALVTERYLSRYGCSFDQTVAINSYDFTPVSDFAKTLSDDSLGSLITDSYIYAVEQAEGGAGDPIDFAITASGVIRDTIPKGSVTISDVFNVSAIGSGADGAAAYPLISVYLSGSDVRDLLEVDATVSSLMSAAQLYGSGIEWSVNTSRMLFDRVTDFSLIKDGQSVPIEDDRLYRVITGLYCGQMLSSVGARSYGILSIVPKDSQGVPISDFEDCIIYDSDGSELKDWYALAMYLESMGGEMSEKYSGPDGRKNVYSSLAPAALLGSPGMTTISALAAVAVLLALVVFIVYRCATRKKRRSRQGKRRN